jgi:hypothetical protein
VSIKQTALAAGLIDAAALALFATGAYLSFGPVAAVVVLLPAALVIGLVGQARWRRKRAGEPLTWGDSFGSRKTYLLSALYTVIAGIGLTYAAKVLGRSTEKPPRRTEGHR